MNNKGVTMLEVVFSLFLMGLLWSLVMPTEFLNLKIKEKNLEDQEAIEIYRDLEIIIKSFNKTKQVQKNAWIKDRDVNNILSREGIGKVDFYKNKRHYYLEYKNIFVSNNLSKIELKLNKGHGLDGKKYEKMEFIIKREQRMDNSRGINKYINSQSNNTNLIKHMGL